MKTNLQSSVLYFSGWLSMAFGNIGGGLEYTTQSQAQYRVVHIQPVKLAHLVIPNHTCTYLRIARARMHAGSGGGEYKRHTNLTLSSMEQRTHQLESTTGSTMPDDLWHTFTYRCPLNMAPWPQCLDCSKSFSVATLREHIKVCPGGPSDSRR